jgi:hypothetical protein
MPDSEEEASPAERLVTADLIARAEKIVGDSLEASLHPYLELATRVTNAAGELIEHVQNSPGEMRAIHACATLIARLIGDLQACSLLVRHGYAPQALSLTAGMFEMAHTSMYISADEERATRWLQHEDPGSASPWRLRKIVNAVARELDAPQSAADHHYDEIYQQLNMPKHGNPMALAYSSIISRDDWKYIVAGPNLEESTTNWARAALVYGVRYTRLASIAFARDHLPGSHDRDRIFHELERLSHDEADLASGTSPE